jgi:hypothetical protein
VLVSNDLDQDALPAPAVELAVKDLLPRAEVEPLVGDRHDDLAAHHLSFQMGIGVAPSTPPFDTLGGASGRASPVRLWR